MKEIEEIVELDFSTIPNSISNININIKSPKTITEINQSAGSINSTTSYTNTLNTIVANKIEIDKYFDKQFIKRYFS